MQRAAELFNETQRQQVEEAVASAEAATSCEIVPVVARASGRYDRAEDMVGLWLAVLAALVCWLTLPRGGQESGDWESSGAVWGPVVLVLAMVLFFIVGAVAASRVSWLRRLFTPRSEMQQEVMSRARETFFDKRVHHTASGSGLLVYVSLHERLAVVLGDERVLEAVSQTVLDELCADLTARLRSSGPAEILPAFIADTGKRLADKLPATESRADELPNALILMD
ncbi:MAG: hypothetical protein NXI04_25440 [Planctomycetaceae bacterium]|nr:hypothetical protein [Planctomycetaceae bacterium]